MPIDPAPEETLITRGVVVDLDSRGAKASKTRAGPVAFVVNAVVRRSERGSGPSLVMPALLTRASMLVDGQLDKGTGGCRGNGYTGRISFQRSARPLRCSFRK